MLGGGHQVCRGGQWRRCSGINVDDVDDVDSDDGGDGGDGDCENGGHQVYKGGQWRQCSDSLLLPCCLPNPPQSNFPPNLPPRG